MTPEGCLEQYFSTKEDSEVKLPWRWVFVFYSLTYCACTCVAELSDRCCCLPGGQNLSSTTSHGLILAWMKLAWVFNIFILTTACMTSGGHSVTCSKNCLDFNITFLVFRSNNKTLTDVALLILYSGLKTKKHWRVSRLIRFLEKCF